MHIHFIIHESFEGPGYFSLWAQKHQYTVSTSRVYLGEPLPDLDNETQSRFDLLIVLGGPQNPATSQDECPHFDTYAEQRLIRDAMNRKKAVVGVCLGAQLIGEALGATYSASPEKEIGYFPVRLSDQGQSDPKLSTFKAEELVGHWHNDMPGLTAESQILATSEGCPRQIVRYSNLVYGFQCHLEFLQEQLPPLIEHDAPVFCQQETARSPARFVQMPADILAYDTTRMNQLLGDFLDKLVADYKKEQTKTQ